MAAMVTDDIDDVVAARVVVIVVVVVVEPIVVSTMDDEDSAAACTCDTSANGCDRGTGTACTVGPFPGCGDMDDNCDNNLNRSSPAA